MWTHQDQLKERGKNLLGQQKELQKIFGKINIKVPSIMLFDYYLSCSV